MCSQITAASDWPRLFCTLGDFFSINFTRIDGTTVTLGCDILYVLLIVGDNVPYSLLFRASYLFHIPYTLDLLPYYLSIANGTGSVVIFELFVFECFV